MSTITVTITPEQKRILDLNGELMDAKETIARLEGCLTALRSEFVPQEEAVSCSWTEVDCEELRGDVHNMAEDLSIAQKNFRIIREQVIIDQEKNKKLEVELAETKSQLETVREDFRATDEGWEQLGKGLAAILGLEWDCNNEELLATVASMKQKLVETKAELKHMRRMYMDTVE